MTVDAAPARAQLIRIETDRRLGHEWDEWDGKPLPGHGDFSAPPGLFFRFAALTIAALTAAAAALLFLLAPRLADLWAGLPRALWLALGAATGLGWLWFAALLVQGGAGRRVDDRGPLRGAGVRRHPGAAGAAGDPGAAATRGRGRGVRARHDHGAAGRGGQAPRARPDDASPQWPLPGRHARPGLDGAMGEELGRVVATVTAPTAACRTSVSTSRSAAAPPCSRRARVA